jgi:putative hydrolases of HD superfamily
MDFDYDNYIELLQKINKLKKLKRKGWVLKNVSNPESVAEHSFQTSIMVLLLADKFNLDKSKCIQMALIHDVCECIVGDITPHDNIAPE